MSKVPPRTVGTLYREVWRIQRQILSDRSPYRLVGHDGWPTQELVRFRTSQHLGFAGQDLVDVKVRRSPEGVETAELAVDCLGLTGARGALPAHYTEMVLAQVKSRAPALRDFLDLFNHRLLSLFYRSWEKTQQAVHQERFDDDPFSRILRSLANAGQDWEIYYGAALARGACSATTIQAVLSDLTQMPVQVRSLEGGWERFAAEDQTRLPSSGSPQGQYARLGDAILGAKVWAADKSAQIVFYPRDRRQLQSLLPNGRFSAAVAKLAGRLVRDQVRLRYRVVTAPSELMDVRLGQQGYLGANSFISARRLGQKVEVSFKPSQGKG